MKKKNKENFMKNKLHNIGSIKMKYDASISWRRKDYEVEHWVKSKNKNQVIGKNRENSGDKYSVRKQTIPIILMTVT